MANFTPNLTFTSGENATSTKINDVLNNILAVFPVGALLYIHQSPTTTETTYLGKWIQCNGTLVSTTTYATLFGVVGTSYGSGTGTFGLPDLRGRPPFSVATSGHADVNAFGDNDGAALANRRTKHSHTFANGTHSHSWSGTLASAGSHSHTYTRGGVVQAGDGVGSSGLDWDASSTTTEWTGTESANHTHTATPTPVSGNAVAYIGNTTGTTDQPAYIVAGCWYMAYS